MSRSYDSGDSRKTKRIGLLIWFRLSRIYNQSIRKNNEHLKQWNLTSAQFDVLVQVGIKKAMTQKELAQKLFVTKGNITQLLSKMEKLGLIQRKQEWKTKTISLTDTGRQLFEEVVPVQEHFQSSHFHGLDPQEQEQLLTLLKKLQKNIESDDDKQ